MNRSFSLGLIIAAVVLIIAAFSLFTVDERERAIVLRLGEIVRADYSPGLHFKLPIVETVRKFDSRLIPFDASPERYLTAEKKNVIVDSFVKWRIDAVDQYFITMGGDESRANLRLGQIIKQELRSQFGKRTIQEVVSGERAEIMDILTVNTNKEAQKFGIDVVDVRIKRIDLPEEVSHSVYERMEAERMRVAKDLRSKGMEAAEKIRADADKQRTIILAEAYGEAEQVRGEGDQKASAIYAEAYSKNRHFYEFYRSLLAYRKSFLDGRGVFVLQPDGEFFRYFKQAEPGAGATQ